MRVSRFLLSTLKEAPAEAELVSHRLMLRAGMIKRLAAGIYTWMPLGLRVMRKVETIVREEMNRSGAIELLMPVVQPAELWRSGRWGKYGPTSAPQGSARTRLRRAADVEEVITDIARKELKATSSCRSTCITSRPSFATSAAALRRDAFARIHHEGRVFVRHGQGRDAEVVSCNVRRLHAHLQSDGLEVSRRRGRHGPDRRQRVGRSRCSPNRARTRSRGARVGLRGERQLAEAVALAPSPGAGPGHAEGADAGSRRAKPSPIC